ncbi:xanthine dehydrogenase family protein molybdopterin-binding subunit [Acidomonas methanolica]|uniref:Aldehyde dehydrogenase large subunit n=1 Tax=Acidomonas methanolica NBRC 104435 TaxID=1231351 RepID=A0A023D8K3_ACIMT|nr:molybdopterin cofactor-binding domain-containing protein [Acidomonas methanolica]MBU2655152.1 molybdopterin-dependent oxidoreductase [Acidomonas methanolica]TCS25189.1 isoquinoline 1-oxidoreductase beta subunit [Acidomonas methanolica]GAJ30126.1 aldehyde dehydrogenase large subunit [Acidomonas methanolica NBRC 104435]GBQ52341.1 aldehyde dehydrogenase large subunit [Acidomonas methanolica]GEK99684.1 aldehyde dehydrogenase [Acidomonas methanolica NBRC 104435]
MKNLATGVAEPSRRGFLAGATGLIVAGLLPARRAFGRPSEFVQGVLSDVENAPFAPGAYIRIAPTQVPGDSGVTFILPNVEMGQGIYTGSVVLIAEELGIDPERVNLEAAPPDAAYILPELGTQATGGSTSTIFEWTTLREAGAAARVMLIQAAATRWNCPVTECEARQGQVVHTPSNRSFAFADLAEDAAKVPPPKDVPLKPARDWTLIGRPRHRLDSRAKIEGRPLFGIDIRVPDMKHATVAACPVLGGKVGEIDRDAALRVPGVKEVLTIDDAVCVVADHYWAAKKGLEALAVVWREGANASVDTAQIYRELHDGLSEPHPIVAHSQGDAAAVFDRAVSRFEAIYQQPLLAHSPMEPINCTIHVRPDGADVWVGTQVPLRARDSVANITGLPKENVHLHSQYIGGGFGRRLEHEYVTQAARFARQVPYPLQIVWSREEDLMRDRFRPAYVDHVRAGLDRQGGIQSMEFRIVGPAVVARWAPAGLSPNGFDNDLAGGILETPYTYPASRLDFVRREAPGVVTAWWRGVGGTRGLFVVESFIDELAQRANADPVAYRRALIHDHPRAREVLDLAAEKSGWGTPLPKGHGRGVSVQFLFKSYLATVVEVDMSAPGQIRIVRVTVAADCGQPVNPDQIRAQIEGGVIFGLGTALFNEITLKNGRVQENNFNLWRILRMNEAPRIDTHLVNSTEAPGGVGETGTAAAAPALANAIAAASGRRLRTLPLMPGVEAA